MERIKTSKIKITVALLLTLTLLVAVLAGAYIGKSSNDIKADAAVTTAKSYIDDTGVGTLQTQLRSSDEGANDLVNQRWGVSGYNVVWIKNDSDLMSVLNPSSAAGTTGANTIGIFENNVDWTIDSMEKVGTQKFEGILDGNGYNLNIKLNTHGAKGGNDSYYRVTASDASLGASANNFSGWSNTNVRAMGLIAGVNAGTIANMVVNYSVEGDHMQAPRTTTGGDVADSNSLDSPFNADCPYAYGIVAGVNLGKVTNVRVSQNGMFNGNTRAYNSASAVSYIHAANNTSIVGIIAGVNMGYGEISYSQIDINAAVWAQADGFTKGAANIYALALAGGIAGSITGDNSKISYCYITGNGNISSFSIKAHCFHNVEDSWRAHLAASGAVTSGKIAIGEDEKHALNMNYQQVRGIISDWQGVARDSHFKNDIVGGNGAQYESDANKYTGALFGEVTGDAVNDHQDFIVTTYNISEANGGADYIDMLSQKIKSWTQIYPEKHSSYINDSVFIKFEGERLRIEARSESFDQYVQANPEKFANVKSLDEVVYTDANNAGNYPIQYDSSYTGSMIWNISIFPLTGGEASSVVNKPNDKYGSMVKYLSAGNVKSGSYVISFGKIYDYTLSNPTAGNSKPYDGKGLSGHYPVMTLKSGSETEVPSASNFVWTIRNSNNEVVQEADTIYPDSYKFYVSAPSDGTFAYYDEASRVLAVNKNDSITVTVTKAVLSLSYNYSDTWVSNAMINVSLTSGGSTISEQIIDAYSYRGGTNNNITDFTNALVNNGFYITESESTPSSGRVINSVSAYKKVTNADGTVRYVLVADTTGAPVKTAKILIDATAPVITSESFYKAQQFGASDLNEIYNLVANAPDGKYQKLTREELENGKWINENVIAVVNVSDEGRSGIASLGVQESSSGSNFINVAPERTAEITLPNGDRVLVIRMEGSPYLRISATDKVNKQGSLKVNGGNPINIDTTEITFLEDPADAENQSYMGSTDPYVYSYSYDKLTGMAYSALVIKFLPSFGGAGLKMSYMIVPEADGDNAPSVDDEGWIFFKNDFVNHSGVEFPLSGVEMTNSRIYLKFESDTDYEVAKPVIVKLRGYSSGTDYEIVDTFSVKLSDADIEFLIEYLQVNEYDGNGQLVKTYNFRDLFKYDTKTLERLFSKQYDGSTALNSKKVEIVFKDGLESITEGTHYFGQYRTMGVQSEFESAFKNYVKIVAEFESAEVSGEARIRLYLEDADNSPYRIQFKLREEAFGQDAKDYIEFVSSIEKMPFNITVDQIFEYSDTVLANGSYDKDQNTLNWKYGYVFDGSELSMPDMSGTGRIYFRLKVVGDAYDKYLNVEGNYSVIVDAIKIVSEGMNYDDVEYVVLSDNGDGTYSADAGKNYHVTISEPVKLAVSAREVRLNFELDGNSAYSFNINYDANMHVMKAYYTDVDGVRQEAVIKWYMWDTELGSYVSIGGEGITTIGSYKVEASTGSANYVVKGQSSQELKIIATYLDVTVEDQQLQFTGSELSYIPTVNTPLPEGLVPKFTFIYYDGITLKPLEGITGVTNVGDYYVRIIFDPSVQTDERLKVYGEMEYFKQDTGEKAAVEENYTKLSVIPANTKIVNAGTQKFDYTKGAKQYYKVGQTTEDKKNIEVMTEKNAKIAGYDSLQLQYWDEASQSYKPVDVEGNAGTFTDVGDYKYRLYYPGDGNYNESSVEVVMTISPIDITGVVFGGTMEGESADLLGVKRMFEKGKGLSLAADVTSSNVNGEDVKITYKYLGTLNTFTDVVPEFTNVGRYEVTARIECNNYNTLELNAMIIVTTAKFDESHPPITFTGDGAVIEVTYDGKPHTITYTVDEEYYEGIQVITSMISATDVGVYAGNIHVTVMNYGDTDYQTKITINPVLVGNDDIDISEITDLQQNEGLTSDTDLTDVSVSFKGVDGKTVEAGLIFWNDKGEIVNLDSYGCLPAGKYTVTYDMPNGNYKAENANVGLTLTIAQGEGNKNPGTDPSEPTEPGDCEHVDANGDKLCDKCGASLGNVTPPKENKTIVYVVVAICAVAVVVSIAGVVIAAVKRSKRNKDDRQNII